VNVRRTPRLESMNRIFRRLGLDPSDYLRDAFTRLPSLPAGRMDDLLPDRWTADRADVVPGAARGNAAAPGSGPW
jgi:hypothetical protein